MSKTESWYTKTINNPKYVDPVVINVLTTVTLKTLSSGTVSHNSSFNADAIQEVSNFLRTKHLDSKQAAFEFHNEVSQVGSSWFIAQMWILSALWLWQTCYNGRYVEVCLCIEMGEKLIVGLELCSSLPTGLRHYCLDCSFTFIAPRSSSTTVGWIAILLTTLEFLIHWT